MVVTTFGDGIAIVLVIFLAVYGCAQLVRRVCLWLTRCPDCAVCCRIAVPRNGVALAPLVRCLQSQSVWDEAYRHTLLLIPSTDEEQRRQLVILRREAPSVIPVTSAQLCAMLLQLAAENSEEKERKERK